MLIAALTFLLLSAALLIRGLIGRHSPNPPAQAPDKGALDSEPTLRCSRTASPPRNKPVRIQC